MPEERLGFFHRKRGPSKGVRETNLVLWILWVNKELQRVHQDVARNDVGAGDHVTTCPRRRKRFVFIWVSGGKKRDRKRRAPSPRDRRRVYLAK